MDIIGKISSIQTMGTVDGPGVRFIVFMQGCPLRCAYCHNPETWDIYSGENTTALKLFEQIKRYKPYIKNGGVTLSGGEPLMQPKFTLELLKLCKQNGIHTAIDTSGSILTEETKEVLAFADLVLLDIKQNTEENYKTYIKSDFSIPISTLKYLGEINKPIWIRQVILPQVNDSIEEMNKLFDIIKNYKNIEKVELLPFKNLCLEKYTEMNLDFELKDMPQMNTQKTLELNNYINKLLQY